MSAHVLIAGPTASGKSALALALARRLDAVVVNADALQVYDAWRVLTARPDDADLARAPHALYGHVPARTRYSVGAWLRDLAPLVDRRLIVVGGTGLYLSALTRGLADIPPIPPDVRAEAEALRADPDRLRAYLARHDPALHARIDLANPARLQRGFEVHRATGRPLSDWQAQSAPALIAPGDALWLRLDAPVDWLDARIAQRFERMVEAGALDEVRAARAWWDPDLPAARALGARELMAHIDGTLGLEDAVHRAQRATRRFAKRQRTWLRSNMSDWTAVDARAAGDDGVADALASLA